jgi:DNA processing protein
MAILAHWVWLSRLQGISPRTISELLDFFGSPLEIYNAPEKALSEVPGISAREISLLLDRDMGETEAIIERCQRLGISILTRQDAAYPERLAAIQNPPAVLYTRGKFPAFDTCPAIAIVGARNASPYGLAAARKIAFDLACSGVVIVSGMALGCDGAAHSGAIEAGRPTVAVLGCGVDYVIRTKTACFTTTFPAWERL